jgi:hypothetical protein
LFCTACPDGSRAAEQFLTGSYGTYIWAGNDLTITSNESNFERHFAGAGVHSVTLKKESVSSSDYLTSGKYSLDAKNIDGGVWKGIFYLNGKGFRYITITLKSDGHCTVQPGLSVEEGIKFPEDLKIKGKFTQANGPAEMISSTGMPTYTAIFFNSIKLGSLKTTWGAEEVETFTDCQTQESTNTGGKITTKTWKGSSQLFANRTAANVYYKKIYKYDTSNNFISGEFEIFIPKDTVLPAILE